VPASIPVIGGMTLTQSEEENNRRVLKLQTCELALLNSTKRVNEFKNEFKSLMPKIFSSFRATGALSFIRVKMQLMNFAGFLGQQGENTKSITDRFKEHISTMYSSSLATKGIKKFAMMGFEPMLQSTLTALSKEWMKRKYFSNDSRRATSSACPGNSSLNMSLESTACLAACPPTSLPALPTCIRKSVGQETCVWFNAFSGRVYRDIARSEYFHDWLLEKLTTELNKGVKPGFVDDFVVESVSFGSTPPLLLNILWAAPVVTPSVNEEVKGAKDYVEINKNYSSESNSDLGSPTYATDSDVHSGIHGSKIKKGSISSPGSNNRRKNSDLEHCTQSDSSSAEQGPRSDEDIECTADVAFRSGLKFKASTRSVTTLTSTSLLT
jgi:hypothetical protein